MTKSDGVTLLKEGDIVKLPKLAATMRQIADDPFTFYNGSLAADIAADIQDAGRIGGKDVNENTFLHQDYKQFVS